MKNGTMFSDLKKYLNTDFLNAHRTVRLETADGVFLFTARVIQNRLEDDRRSKQGSIDRKLRRKIEEKKQAQGLKQ